MENRLLIQFQKTMSLKKPEDNKKNKTTPSKIVSDIKENVGEWSKLSANHTLLQHTDSHIDITNDNPVCKLK